ncbi:RNA 2',3'-cyclic phosphodiesterase [Nitrosophilus kaiyonis]|uniref:RNA 2',3'-cyclic phosphodiesterase n=1 Tax=Nitrosophilus kaiyonis TaxID=2930200 RepID=UPI002492B424|nr:RNA 2',3'-cyclic phosphodiesterase [Nitrosophilus kaiyonis]
MRLFLGTFAKIEGFENIKKDFSNIIEGKWVEDENIHLTYIFLGNVEDPKEIILKLKDIKFKKKSINIRGLGYFGRPPKILYANINDKEIKKLYEKLCKKLHLDIDDNFISHITLIRIKKVKGIKKFLEMVEKYKNRKLGVLHLKLALIKSELTPKGPKYSIIKEF